VRLIANATAAHYLAAITHEPLGSANTEAFARDDCVPTELAAALRQVLSSTKDVSLTDGYKRNLRQEGDNLNVMFGSMTAFVTFNFADNYAPILFKPCNAEEVIGDITRDLTAEQPDMPSMQQPSQQCCTTCTCEVIAKQCCTSCTTF
jgi:hypothetical protein